MRRVRMGFDSQGRAVFDNWINVRARGTAALAIAHGGLVDTDALLGLAIEILGEGEIRLARGLQPDFTQRVIRLRLTDTERTPHPVIGSCKPVVVFGAPKVGEHFVIGPSGITQSSPVVVVGPMA